MKYLKQSTYSKIIAVYEYLKFPPYDGFIVKNVVASFKLFVIET